MLKIPNEESPDSLLEIIQSIEKRVNQLEARLSGHKAVTDDVRSQGQNQVLVRLIQDDLKALRRSAVRADQDVTRLSQLTQVMKVLVSSLELEKVLTEVMDATIGFLGAQRAFLILLDNPSAEPQIHIARNWTQETLLVEEISFSRSIVQRVIQTRTPILTNSLQEESLLHHLASTALVNVHMVACMPLLYDDQLIGVMYADSTMLERDVRLELAAPVLSTFADQAAIAIQNARGYDEMRSNLNLAQREIQQRLSRETVLIRRPDEMFQTMIRSVVQLLELPYVTLDILQGDEFQPVATYGEIASDAEAHPLIFHQETIGRLRLPPHAASKWMFESLRQQITLMVYAIRAGIELQHSREKLVIAREKERRSVRDELHDVIGSRLTIMPIWFDLAATAEAEESRRFLMMLKTQVQSIVAEIQRFTRQLPPMSLDQLGLAGAIDQLVQEINATHVIQISLSVPAELPPLYEALKTGAYRIVNEALTNVVRHSHADTCSAQLEVQGDELCITVNDNGQGITEKTGSGVGLKSMQECAAELGGTFEIVSQVGIGTTIKVRLPLFLERLL